MFPHPRLHPFVLLAGALCLAALLSACAGTIKYESGRRFDPALIGTTLRAGTSTKADVRRVLGTPFGTGTSMMPHHATPHETWTYFYDHGTVDLGTMKANDELYDLFLFFDGDKLDSYIWFTARQH